MGLLKPHPCVCPREQQLNPGLGSFSDFYSWVLLCSTRTFVSKHLHLESGIEYTCVPLRILILIRNDKIKIYRHSQDKLFGVDVRSQKRVLKC